MLNLMWLAILATATATPEIPVFSDDPAEQCSVHRRHEAMLTGDLPLTHWTPKDGSRPMTESERLAALERVRAQLQTCPTAQQMAACEKAYESTVDGIDGMPDGRGLRILIIAQRERRQCLARPRES